MYQVLVSIQGMILGVTHPIYNEPGLGGFESHERPGGGDGGGGGGGGGCGGRQGMACACNGGARLR